MDAFAPFSVFMASDGFKEMSLLGRYDYTMPFYNINGNLDYQANYSLACEYFEKDQAPVKHIFVMNDDTHGLLASRSEEFSGYLHRIAAY